MFAFLDGYFDGAFCTFEQFLGFLPGCVGGLDGFDDGRLMLLCDFRDREFQKVFFRNGWVEYWRWYRRSISSQKTGRRK